jgi:hypothetical protein
MKRSRPIKRYIKFYTPDTIGLIGSTFYGPGWYDFIEYVDDITGDRILPIQLNLNGHFSYYEDGLIPNIEAPKNKPLSVRWWSKEHLRDHQIDKLFNNIEIEKEQQFTFIGDEKISGNTALKIIEDVFNEFTIPKEIEEAYKYINSCESDLGFMGSPTYYEKKKLVDSYLSNRIK